MLEIGKLGKSSLRLPQIAMTNLPRGVRCARPTGALLKDFAYPFVLLRQQRCQLSEHVGQNQACQEQHQCQKWLTSSKGC